MWLEALLPVQTLTAFEHACDEGCQSSAEHFKRFANAVAVGEGHGGRRSALGSGLEGIDQGEAFDGSKILAVAADQGQVV